FWNGDRWYAQLKVRARTPSGLPLRLVSDQLHAGGGIAEAGKAKEFDYYAHVENYDADSRTMRVFPRLRLTIADLQGNVLGEEEVTVRVERRRHLAWDSI